MQCVLRENLMTLASKLGDVSRVYREESHQFVDAYFRWLEEADTILSPLRSPLCTVLNSEKSSLRSVEDGYVPDGIQVSKTTRKIEKAAAAQSMERVSREIYAKIASIDHDFGELNEKMCHAIAILATKEPNTYAELQVKQFFIDQLWAKLSQTPETLPMVNYFCAKLALTDRNYLMQDIVQKIVSNRA